MKATKIVERVNKITSNKDITIDTPLSMARIELTGCCTLNCKFCAHNAMRENGIRQTFMKDDDFDFVISKIEEIPTIKEIGLFYMGESGLHNKLDEYYKKVHDKGYFTFLTTNGTYITNILRALPYIDSLKVSWNYKNSKDFVKKTGSNIENYDIILHNIKRLFADCHNLNKGLSISTVLCNEETKDDYMYVLSNIPYDEHYFINIHGSNDISKPSNDKNISNGCISIPCWSLFKGLYIDVDLNVRSCTYGNEDINILGNLRREDVFNKHVMSKDRFKRAQLKGDIPKMCMNCLNA